LATQEMVLEIFTEKLSNYFDVISVSKNLNDTCVVSFKNTNNGFKCQRILNLDFSDDDINKITENILLLIKYK
jgi:hypothetical protein